jgi:hypothetical protein
MTATMERQAVASAPAYQPRFVAYARAHGRSPEAQLTHDQALWPGGRMLPFLQWIQQQREVFAAAHPEHMMERAIRKQEVFTRWCERVADDACWARAIAPLVPDPSSTQDFA